MSDAPLPTAAQVSVTRQQIVDQENKIVIAERHIREYERQIQDCKTCITALQSKVLDIRKDIATKNAYLAPIRRLPFEVVGEIVTLCATDLNAPVQQLRVLSSICKTWRDATLRTPKAWTKIIIVISDYLPVTGGPASRDTLHTVQDVQEWYDRSGCCKKDVSIAWYGRYQHRYQQSVTGELDAIIQIIISRASELRRFAPNLGDERNTRCLSLPMPLLHAVDLLHIEADIGFMSTLAISSPQLTCLRVGNLSSGDVLIPLQSRLKSLVIDRVNLNVLQQMLSSGGFAGLQALCILCLESPAATMDYSTILLPDLRAFHVRDLCSEASLFELFDMPRLESFACKYVSDARPSKKDGAAFLRLLTDRRLPLRELRLENIWMPDADLLRLLKVTPGLESLVILNGKTSDKVMSALSCCQTRPARWLCPELSRVCIVSHKSSKSDKFKVSRAALEELVIARRDAHRARSAPGATPKAAQILDVHLNRKFLAVGSMNGDLRWEPYLVDNPDDLSMLASWASYTRKHPWWMVRTQWGELS